LHPHLFDLVLDSLLALALALLILVLLALALLALHLAMSPSAGVSSASRPGLLAGSEGMLLL